MPDLIPGADLQANAAAVADSLRLASVAASKTLVPAAERFVKVDATAGNVTLTVPLAATVGAGVAFTIKRVDVNVDNFAMLVPSGSDTFDFTLKLILGIPSEHVTLVSDGVDRYFIVNRRTQAFGSISYENVTPDATFAVTNVEQVFPVWDTNRFKTAGRLTPVFGSSKVTIDSFINEPPAEDGYAVTFNLNFQLGTNVNITFRLYVGGVDTKFGSTIEGDGTEDISTGFTAKIGVVGPAPKDVEIRCISPTAGPSTLTVNFSSLVTNIIE